MTWNHRVMRRTNEHGETWYDIHEVYYETDPCGVEKLSWTEDAIAPMGETVDELREELERMLRALDKPVLEYGGGDDEARGPTDT